MESSHSQEESQALISIAQSNVDEVLHLSETSLEGLSETEAKQRLSNSPYAEFSKTLTPSPSPLMGEGNKKTLNFIFAPLLPSWEKGLGDILSA